MFVNMTTYKAVSNNLMKVCVRVCVCGEMRETIEKNILIKP